MPIHFTYEMKKTFQIYIRKTHNKNKQKATPN